MCTLSEQLSCVRQELEGEKRKVHLLEQQLVTAGIGGGSDGGGGGGGQKSAERLATLEMQALSEKQRGDLASLRHRQARELAEQLELRNAELEERFSELMRKLLQAQAKEVELSDQLASELSSLVSSRHMLISVYAVFFSRVHGCVECSFSGALHSCTVISIEMIIFFKWIYHLNILLCIHVYSGKIF